MMMMRGWKPASVRAALALACSTAVLMLTGSPAQAIGPTVTGEGSTWVQIALDQWRADIARQGYSINYQGYGSSAGRSAYIINQVDFAASEIPFQPDEVAQLQGEHKSYQYLPDVAGGTSLMYNLHAPSGGRITNLRIDAVTAAKIFTGAITSWHDSAIQALNPGLQISETTVIPVIRSDGSGTSAQFSLFLAAQAAGQWNAFVSGYGCPAPCSQWPPFPGSTQQKGSDGVANFVANDALGGGAVGYVEAGYAFGRNFPVANLRNASGNFTQPSSANVATALVHATLHADLTQDLTNVYAAPEPNAYPMSSYSYMITPTANFDPAKGNVLGTWLIYIACAGQREAAPLGYSPLPPNLVAAVFDAVRRIPGAPTPPPIDRDHCPNPTITNAAAGGGGVVPGPAGSGSTTTSSSGHTTSGAAGGNASGTGAQAAAAQGPLTGADSAAAAASQDVANTDQPGDPANLLPSHRHIDTLSDVERQGRITDAVTATGKLKVPPLRAEFIVAGVVLVAIFVPMLFGPGSIIAEGLAGEFGRKEGD